MRWNKFGPFGIICSFSRRKKRLRSKHLRVGNKEIVEMKKIIIIPSLRGVPQGRRGNLRDCTARFCASTFREELDVLLRKCFGLAWACLAMTFVVVLFF